MSLRYSELQRKRAISKFFANNKKIEKQINNKIRKINRLFIFKFVFFSQIEPDAFKMFSVSKTFFGFAKIEKVKNISLRELYLLENTLEKAFSNLKSF